MNAIIVEGVMFVALLANLTCAIHGAHEERAMVRLESGEVMCPEWYRDAVDGRECIGTRNGMRT